MRYHEFLLEHKSALTNAQTLDEESPNTLHGSFSKDLISSKKWLCKILKQIAGNQNLGKIYVLGSWYGNLALFIQKSGLIYDQIILIDLDKNVLDKSEKILNKFFNPKQLNFMHKDASKISYDQPGIVINTSSNDMNTDWYDNVPNGMRVVIQGRDKVSSLTKYIDIKDFSNMFPMNNIEYLGKKELRDPKTDYTRYMKIGIR